MLVCCLAQVAELVDALGSGPSGGNTVGVRVPSWAPPRENGLPSWRPFSLCGAPFGRSANHEAGKPPREEDAAARARQNVATRISRSSRLTAPHGRGAQRE